MTSNILRLYKALPEPLQKVVPKRIRLLVGYGVVGSKFRKDYKSKYESAILNIYESDVLPSPEIHVLDIGARFGKQKKFDVLGEIGKLRLTGIEPDENECRRLQKAYPEYSFVDTAISDERGLKTLYLTSQRGWSSLYRPNEAVLKRFEFCGGKYDVENEVEVETTTLDKLAAEREDKYDFIKIDTQGSEGDIIAGGRETLRSTVGIEFETHFKSIYQNQPLFFDIHQQLSDAKLELIDINTHEYYRRWTKEGIIKRGNNRDGELIQQDPLYMTINCEDRIKVFKSIVISLIFGKKSVAHYVINENQGKLSMNEVEEISRILTKIP